jgi:RNA polymerase Rpb1, domain 5
MTLKTFHFAGVASMNVTLGVPRLKVSVVPYINGMLLLLLLLLLNPFFGVTH